MERPSLPPLWISLLPLAFLICMLGFNVWIFEDPGAGANQLTLLLSAMFAAALSWFLSRNWKNLEKGMIKSISAAMPAILILLLIGALAGTWMISGIVPAMVYYGLKLLSPSIFIPAACLVCAVISIATGSSWTTVGTVGIALLGMGKTMNFDTGLVAGAIISGAYFGDKLSPLSDTTNLAPAMAGTDLFTHIRYMLYTTIPSIVISLVVFSFLGYSSAKEINQEEIRQVEAALQDVFYISPILFLVPVLVIVLIILRMPAFPVLLLGSLAGGIFAAVFQQEVVQQIGGQDDFLLSAYIAVIHAMTGDIAIPTSSEMLNELFKTGGMAGMLATIWLILSAMIFGGVMEAAGFLGSITERIVRSAKSTTSLFASTIGTCIFFNTTASDQYLSIVVPGRMYRSTFASRGLNPENLSRTLEDSGTVTSVLVPWNTCGATISAFLQVSTLVYFPWCIFNLISPFMSLLVAATGWKIRKMKESVK